MKHFALTLCILIIGVSLLPGCAAQPSSEIQEVSQVEQFKPLKPLEAPNSAIEEAPQSGTNKPCSDFSYNPEPFNNLEPVNNLPDEEETKMVVKPNYKTDHKLIVTNPCLPKVDSGDKRLSKQERRRR